MFSEEIRVASWRRSPRSQKFKVSHGMPTRHLTDAQRQGFARFDGEPSADQLARYFHLDQTDRDLIGTLRGGHNRLGFAVMLTSARFLGAFPVSPAEIPASVLAIVIEQLAIDPSLAAWIAILRKAGASGASRLSGRTADLRTSATTPWRVAG